MRTPVIFQVIVTVAVACFVTGCGGPSEQKTPPPPAVEVATPVRRDVTSYYHYTGNLEAVASVEVRARVGGTLEEMHFIPSTQVEAGTPLFTIETEPYDIGVQAAEAAVQAAEAARDLAALERQQIQEAFDKNAANEREVEKYVTTLRTRDAELLAAQAQLRDAKLQRSYADVVAPIAGRVSRNLVDVGTLVGVGEPTLLTTVVQMDPIYVYVDVSERIVLEYLGQGRTGEVKSEQRPNAPVIEIARASDPPGSYPFSGKVDYADSVVDQGTGTLQVRGNIANPEGNLFPGLFVRARVAREFLADAVLVREDALGTDLSGKFVLVGDEKNIVSMYPVTVGDRTGDGYVVITEGLDGSERYVAVGIQKARPGRPVTIRQAAALPATSANPPLSTEAGGE